MGEAKYLAQLIWKHAICHPFTEVERRAPR